MPWFAQAPSNIALIKYMGKVDAEKNLPLNPSLSYTLNNLLSSVSIEQHNANHDDWEPLSIPGALPFSLAKAAQDRFLQHFSRIKAYFNYSGSFIIRSCNNFPHSSGLASSASSFAALTKCAVLALSELTEKSMPSVETQAQLSRLGSGSSCRSFFTPWALWEDDKVHAIELPYSELIHQVIVISHHEKKVSSSEAHRRITSSPHYSHRAANVKTQLDILIKALQNKNWQSAYEVCWQEFQDLHRLFSSCADPFSYMTAQSKAALDSLQAFWRQQGDGPIITMDAGPNIHLLYRPDQAEMALQFKQDYLVGNYDVL